MIEQVYSTKFYLKTKYVAVDPSGTEVHLPPGNYLKYKKSGEELSLWVDFEFVGGVFFTTHVFLPEKYAWESGKEFNAAEIEQLQIDVRDGLAAFESLVLFKTAEYVKERLSIFDKKVSHAE